MKTYIFSSPEKKLREVVTRKLSKRDIARQIANLAELHNIRPESIRMEMK